MDFLKFSLTCFHEDPNELESFKKYVIDNDLNLQHT